jgi:hypothetical protein
MVDLDYPPFFIDRVEDGGSARSAGAADLATRKGTTPARRSNGEKPNRALRVRYLHGYRGVVPPMALIAPFARVARSTNRFHALSLS